MLAAAAHTAGMTWEPLATLIVTFLMVVGGAAGFIVRRIDRNWDKTQAFVESQVKTVSSVLGGRLEDIGGRLERIDHHMVDQDRTASQQNERLARVEGRLSVPPQPGSD